MRICLMVGLGGFFGSICRYLLTLLPVAANGGFPYVTLGINVAGSLLIGVLVGATGGFIPANGEWSAFLKIGFCGGFTTFSTFALEISGLLQTGKGWGAALYITLSTLLGVGAVFAGKALVR